jgi:hypothetical protein
VAVPALVRGRAAGLATCPPSCEQIGQRSMKRLWRQKRGMTSAASLGPVDAHLSDASRPARNLRSLAFSHRPRAAW